jgi:DNA polymerase-3 subunit epsilon
VEVAVLRLGPDLGVVSEFTSLVNPHRDIGPTWIHGIRTADVLDAPRFEELAGSVIDLLRDTVVVGHNVTFDLRFLESEFLRAGARIPRPPYVDTMTAALRTGVPSRRLEEACDLFGITLSDSHSALPDAQATASLFARCNEHLGAVEIQRMVQWPVDDTALPWAQLSATREPWPRSRASAKQLGEQPFLARLIRDLPISDTETGDWQAYYAVLDRALEDRRISDEEGDALRDVAADTGLSAGDVGTANETYLKTLVAVALHDGVLSTSERNDIEEVARLLALEASLPQLLARRESDAERSPAGGGASDLKGRTVCFTGAMNALIEGERATREKASAIALDHGMVVVKGVTRKLDYVVMADPDSLSGKAQKARKYGTRILAEAVFWNLMGVATDG